MTIRRTALAAAAALALASVGAARAERPEPGRARTIDLGAVSGIAYYTVERGGFRVVATLAQGGGETAAAPLRVEAVLAPGQSVVLSSPRGAGAPPDAVEISREADAVLVRKATAALTN